MIILYQSFQTCGLPLVFFFQASVIIGNILGILNQDEDISQNASVYNIGITNCLHFCYKELSLYIDIFRLLTSLVVIIVKFQLLYQITINCSWILLKMCWILAHLRINNVKLLSCGVLSSFIITIILYLKYILIMLSHLI